MKFTLMPLLIVPLLFSSTMSSINFNDYDNYRNNDNYEIISKLEYLIEEHDNETSDISIFNYNLIDENSKVSGNRLSHDEAIKMATVEINSAVSEDNYYTYKASYSLFDFSGNEYVLVTFMPFGSMVMSLYNYETIEANLFDTTKYTLLNDYNEIFYIPTVGFYSYLDGTYSNIFNEHCFNENQIDVIQKTSSKYYMYMDTNFENSITQKISVLSGGGSSGDKDWDVNISEQLVVADVEVPHSWFFKNNTTRFSYANAGANGVCEYVAFLLMIEYFDFFVTAGYFSDEEISKYVSVMNGGSFENAIPNVSDTFVVDLFNKFGRESLNTGDLDDLLNMFMQGKNISYESDNAYWVFGNPKDVISKGRPDMICGMLPDTGNRGDVAHNIVAYGYFTQGTYNGKYLTHYGWNGHTQCIVSRPFLSGYDWSIINKEASHVHRNIFSVNGVLKCGCQSV